MSDPTATAQEAIAEVLRAAISGRGPGVIIERTCLKCAGTWGAAWRPRGDDVQVGFRLEAGAVVEVALLERAQLKAVIVLRRANPVGDTAWGGFGELPWIALDAKDVLAAPLRWRPVGEREPRRVCPDCERSSAPEDRWARIRRIARATAQPVPEGRGSAYWVEPYRCYHESCKAEILVYSWIGHRWMTDDAPPPPIPTTIRHRDSARAGGRYWANVCPKCNRVQGENFVYAPSGPLPARFRGD